MTEYSQADDLLRTEAARIALDTLGAPNEPTRTRAVADRLGVRSVRVPDPRGTGNDYPPMEKREAFVPDAQGNVRLDHEGKPWSVTKFIVDICNLAREKGDTDAQRNIRWVDRPLVDAT